MQCGILERILEREKAISRKTGKIQERPLVSSIAPMLIFWVLIIVL